MMTSSTRVGLGVTALALALTGAVVTAQPANAKADSSCLRAGISTLKDAGLLDDVARDGLSVSFAVNDLGVTAREGTDVGALPDTLPLRLVLADHRAGDDSLLIYPWC